MKIFIGIPCYDVMPPETVEDYMRLLYHLGRRNQEHDFFLGIKRKAEQFRARNSIVQAAYQVGADYLLMLDDDHVINTTGATGPTDSYDILKKLLKHHEDHPDAGVIGALYYHRGGECRPVLMKQQGDAYVYLRDDEIKRDLQEVDVQGGGCMLIKMSVFDKIGSAPFEPEHEYGTDFQVCRKAKEAGFGVYSDTSIEIGHVKNQRSIVTGQNRHEHYAQSINNNDEIAKNYLMAKILREFRADVMEYMSIKDVGVLASVANKYKDHHSKIQDYDDLHKYYRDSGDSYLARACFIRSEDNPKDFDDYVLKTIKADVPGTGYDFGCGAAPISFELCRRGHTIMFHDIPGTKPYEFLKWRADKYNLFGTKALFQDEHAAVDFSSIDYVLCLDSIEHLVEHEWQEWVTYLSNILKPAGCLITNFMLLEDEENLEHVFMDKPRFMQFMTERKLWPLNPAIFQKRTDFNGEKNGSDT